MSQQDLDRVLARPPERQRDGPLRLRARRWLVGAFVDNFALKFVAFILALTVFILVHSDEEGSQRRSVGVSYSKLSDRVLVSERVDQVRLTVKGSRRRLNRFGEADLDNLFINLSGLSNGRYRFDKGMFDIPEGLSLVNIEPDGVDLKFETRVEKTVPVVVDVSGSPARGLKVTEVSADPDEVTISGAESVISRVESVRTQEVNLQARSLSFRDPVLLAAGNFQLESTDTVEVAVTLAEEVDIRSISGQPVEIRSGTGAHAIENFVVEPAEVELLLYGNYSVVQKVVPADIKLYVEIRAADLSGASSRSVEVEWEASLPGIGIKPTPAEVTLRRRREVEENR